MYFIKWKSAVLVIAIIGQVSAIAGRGNVGSSAFNYGADGASFRGGFPFNGLSRTSSSGVYSGISTTGSRENETPKPYKFGYDSMGYQGTHFHREETDASGTVRGSYGYYDFQGLYRVVEYVADARGFRASVRTNEPGTDGEESPANVEMIAERPPPFVQDQYDPFKDAPKGGGGVGPAVSNSFNSTLKGKDGDDDD